jgi:hypothetical protein
VHSSAAERERNLIRASMHHAATQPFNPAHTHSHQQGLVLCHFYYHYDSRPAFESAAQHTSSPRTRTPEFIYFISAGAVRLQLACTTGKRNCSQLHNGHNLDAARCGLSQMEICRYLRVCREHFEMQFSCLLKNSFAMLCKICVDFIPES